MMPSIKNWIASADYDLKTAANLFKSRRYIYVVFLCHLAIEKVLKAIVCKKLNEMPPYTHNLNRLIELAGISVDESYQKFINKISLQSVPTRYPEDFAKLSTQFNKTIAEEHLKKSTEVIKWLKQNYLKRS
ncbi:MAG: HEPN domain-containing protein [Nitrospinae bacterium]|nr:HEPN domain-containing protein [Nitrospinota bacterium]